MNVNRQPPPTSTQPQPDLTLKIYSSKVVPTIRVKQKDNDREVTINEADFDPDRFVRVA